MNTDTLALTKDLQQAGLEPEQAEALARWAAPFATREDLQATREDLRATRDELRREMHTIRDDLRREMQAIRDILSDQAVQIRAMHQSISRLYLVLIALFGGALISNMGFVLYLLERLP